MNILKPLIVAASLLLTASCSAYEPVVKSYVTVDVDGNGTTDFKARTTVANQSKCKTQDEIAHILIHGSRQSTVYLEARFAQLNQDGVCAVMFDLPGHGMTSNEGWGWSQGSYYPMIETAKAVVKDAGLTSYICEGNSLGGNVCNLAHSIGYLSGLKGMVLIGTPPLNIDEHPLPSPFLYDTCAAKLAVERWDVQDLEYELADKLSASYFKDCQLPSPLYKMPARRTEQGVASGLGLSVAVIKEVPDGVAALCNAASSGVKTKFVLGSQDAWVNPLYIDSVINFCGSVNITKDVCYGAGHAVSTEQPYCIKSIVDGFVGDL